MAKTFACRVITPERAVLACEATFVAFPAYDGEMGILPQRAPLIAKLGIGALRVDSPDEHHLLFIDGGFVEMVDNHLTILTEEARWPREIDRNQVEKKLATALAAEIPDEAAFQARQHALASARAQLKILEQAA